MQKILCALFIASAVAYAGGAASLVGKKSSSKGHSYDPMVEMRFINDCAEGANEQLCGCVLEKIKGQYSEKEYLRIDSDLTNNISRPDFVEFVSKAAESCDTNENQPSAEEKIKESVQKKLKNLSKRDFIEDFSLGINNVIGDEASEKIAGCIYDLATNDLDRIAKRIANNSDIDDDILFTEIISDCIPQNFTPDIKRSFSNLLNQEGLPLSISRCVVDKIEEEFTFKNFFLSFTNDGNGINSTFATFAEECSTDWVTDY